MRRFWLILSTLADRKLEAYAKAAWETSPQRKHHSNCDPYCSYCGYKCMGCGRTYWSF